MIFGTVMKYFEWYTVTEILAAAAVYDVNLTFRNIYPTIISPTQVTLKVDRFNRAKLVHLNNMVYLAQIFF